MGCQQDLSSSRKSRYSATKEIHPGYSHTWADKPYYTRIRVDLLRSTGADEFLQRFLGNGEDFVPLKQHLIKRTERNPYITEESVRSLVETGLLIGEKGPGPTKDS